MPSISFDGNVILFFHSFIQKVREFQVSNQYESDCSYPPSFLYIYDHNVIFSLLNMLFIHKVKGRSKVQIS